ncbi:hypothetical protein Y1Q_0024584 [Alligator mississippiensis]|uniref:Uncharacterized protein n=1 Tax=Alligator mississippiensis TaxID=8496 RepID=A0A151NAZ6_ALLMI|nr:hypothetical protein Y1Q_0024584 [Alligator mississippiensis]
MAAGREPGQWSQLEVRNAGADCRRLPKRSKETQGRANAGGQHNSAVFHQGRFYKDQTFQGTKPTGFPRRASLQTSPELSYRLKIENILLSEISRKLDIRASALSANSTLFKICGNRNGCTIIRSQLLHIYQVFLQLSLPPLLSSWVASLFPNMFSTSPRLSGPDAISLMECWYTSSSLKNVRREAQLEPKQEPQ